MAKKPRETLHIHENGIRSLKKRIKSMKADSVTSKNQENAPKSKKMGSQVLRNLENSWKFMKIDSEDTKSQENGTEFSESQENSLNWAKDPRKTKKSLESRKISSHVLESREKSWKFIKISFRGSKTLENPQKCRPMLIQMLKRRLTLHSGIKSLVNTSDIKKIQ